MVHITLWTFNGPNCLMERRRTRLLDTFYVKTERREKSRFRVSYIVKILCCGMQATIEAFSHGECFFGVNTLISDAFSYIIQSHFLLKFGHMQDL